MESLRKGEQETRRFTLEVADQDEAELAVTGRVFPDYHSAIAYAEGRNYRSFLPSADMVTAITKQINDGMYARFELALERGEGGFTAKREWLNTLLVQALKDTSTPASLDVAARLAAITELDPLFGGDRAGMPPVPAAVSARAAEGLKDFRSDGNLSKPIGFFTWTPELVSIFTRDRWLQGWFGEDKRAWLSQDGVISPVGDRNLASGAYLAGLLGGEAGPAHAKTLDFYRRMTNPLSGYSPKDLAQLLPAGKTLTDAVTDPAVRSQMLARSQSAKTPFLQYWAILPPSTSPESELFYRLELAGQLQPGQDRMQVLIDSIRAGKLSLAPTADSGLYAYQQHALEALLTVASLPEGDKLTYGPLYQKRLEEAFKTGLTKARETHAKQLDNPPLSRGVSRPNWPAWVVEPLPTYYERLAASYGFLKTAVFPQFHSDFTSQAKVLTDGGAEGTLSLAAQLDQAEKLTRGLAALAKAEVGLAPVADAALVADAVAWLQTLDADPRLGADTRVAVPVNQYKDGRGQRWMQYWGTAGVTLTKVKASRAGANDETYLLANDKFIFFERPYAAGPLNRMEYRQILDSSATLDQALQRLKGT